MCDSSVVTRKTWIRQLKNTGISKHEIEAGFDKLFWLQCRDNELLIQISSKNNRFGENSREFICSNTSQLTTPVIVSSEVTHQIIPQQSWSLLNISSVNAAEDPLRNNSQCSAKENLPVLPADISITAVTSPISKPFVALDEHEKRLKIREFLCINNISQRIVAELTRIQLPLLESYFSGVINAISEDAKRTLFHWYLKIKCDPNRLQDIRKQFDRTKRKSSELIQTKRERFIFRKQHMEILEKAFSENKYPDLFMKEDIARDCNEAVETLTGSPVAPREQVTIAIVSNWFNNKRKEEKLKSKNKKQRVNDLRCYPRNCKSVVNTAIDSDFSDTSSIYSDGFKSCDALMELSDKDIPEIVVNKPDSQEIHVEDDEDIEEVII